MHAAKRYIFFAALSSSETSALKRVLRHNIPENAILQSMPSSSGILQQLGTWIWVITCWQLYVPTGCVATAQFYPEYVLASLIFQTLNLVNNEQTRLFITSCNFFAYVYCVSIYIQNFWLGLTGLGWVGWAEMGWSELGWAELGWPELSWAELSSAEMTWAGLSWPDLSWAKLRWEELSWAVIVSAWLDWTGLDWAELSWAEMGWNDLSWAGPTWA
jgi:hypothetical protein